MGGWQSVKLGEVAKVYDGTHQTPEYVMQGVPFYSVEHVTSNNFNTTKYVSPEIFEKENQRVKIEKGDILMTRIGDVGKAKYIDWDARASFYVSLALIKCGPTVNPRFLTQLINSDAGKREIWSKTLHVAFPNKINLGDIGKCSFNIPDIEEQERIALTIDTWDEYLEKTDKAIDCMKNIKKGLMQQILSGELRLKGYTDEWITLKLNDIGDIRTSSVDKLSIDGQKKVHLLNYMDVYKRDHIKADDDFQTVTAKNHQITSANLKQGDILFTPSSETQTDIGHSAVVTENLENVVFSYHLIRLRPKNNYLHHRYSAYCFKTFKFYKELWKRAQGATRYTLSKEALQDSSITIPPSIEEQVRIAEIFETIDKEIATLSKKRRQIALERKYLVNNLMSGKIHFSVTGAAATGERLHA